MCVSTCFLVYSLTVKIWGWNGEPVALITLLTLSLSAAQWLSLLHTQIWARLPRIYSARAMVSTALLHIIQYVYKTYNIMVIADILIWDFVWDYSHNIKRWTLILNQILEIKRIVWYFGKYICSLSCQESKIGKSATLLYLSLKCPAAARRRLA